MTELHWLFVVLVAVMLLSGGDFQEERIHKMKDICRKIMRLFAPVPDEDKGTGNLLTSLTGYGCEMLRSYYVPNSLSF